MVCWQIRLKHESLVVEWLIFVFYQRTLQLECCAVKLTGGGDATGIKKQGNPLHIAGKKPACFGDTT
jgi:hypothetical protein